MTIKVLTDANRRQSSLELELETTSSIPLPSFEEERDEERTSKAVDEGGNGDHGAGRLRRLGAGTCQNPSLATITVNTWDELKDCVAHLCLWQQERLKEAVPMRSLCGV